ncbi:MAG: UxaA family hydrolase [Labilibaculum sp.]|nr:UxaA family hydrolase [Labilibaculum sp.]MBI9059817.1 UxaA family hydrolase [Labilibaculum sp.]
MKGYKYKNGDVRIRDELWIISTVGCMNGRANFIVKIFKHQHHTEIIENIHVFGHNYAYSQFVDDHKNCIWKYD